MRIDFTQFGADPPESSKTSRVGQNAGAGSGAGSTAGAGSSGVSSDGAGLDPTRFSFDQTRVASLASQVLAQPEVRGARVRELQLAVSNGEYSVPPGKVADAIVSELGAA
ncbi:MAG: flagellar biosynthesis anti-sigma factor FlgM [Terriglobales bacterium]|jgi:flagellar biosynthesis anti-sigma factor FlgM